MNKPLSSFLHWQVAAFSAGAAAIHFAEISTHFEEYWLFGAFFIVVAWFQAGSAVAIVAHPSRRLVALVVIVNVVTIGIWIWSRTAGLPIGPEAGEPEAIGAADLLATLLEGLLVVWAMAARAPTIGSRSAPARLGILTTVIVWATVIAMTAIVFFTAETMTH